MSDQSKKRKKAYYLKAAKGKRFKHGHILEGGLRGVLITCNNREKEAVREAYNILNQYADDMFGSETEPEKVGDSASEEEEDIEASLKKEVETLQKQKPTDRRFQVVDSGANNCVFIRTTLDRPDTLIHKVLADTLETQKCKSRFIMRIQPVVGTCRADEEKIHTLAESLLPKYLGGPKAHTYCVLVKVRNNSSFGKQQLVRVIREVVQELNPLNSFDGDNPDFVISMDVIKSVCCMSVMEDFFKLRKYNLQEVVKTAETPDGNASEPSAQVAETPDDNTSEPSTQVAETESKEGTAENDDKEVHEDKEVEKSDPVVQTETEPSPEQTDPSEKNTLENESAQ